MALTKLLLRLALEAWARSIAPWTPLDRTVAVKILPAHLSENPEARQRFEREARTISSLNHPHICVLHDVGSQDGAAYLVMEYVQGETLEARLQKGPLPLKQALECGVQICDAMEKAHRAGIVHRDLKPGNIMLTASGAKLLDFGLAKPVAMLGARASNDNRNLTSSAPTLDLTQLSASPAVLTQHGSVVGTYQYMAPEVLQGQEADARSDIFSFGCVLYEMITGRRAFEGKSQLSVMTAILEKDPEPLAALQPTAPPTLDYVVQACLEKDPSNRLQTAHDVKLQLAWIAKPASQVGVPAVPASKRKAGTRWMVMGALAILAVAAIALAAASWSGRSSRRIVRSNILPPPGTQFETLYRNGAPAISPDGTRVAFVARQDGKNSLWLRSLDKLEATPLRGTEDAFFPFWSPDGTALAFFMHAKLWRMDLNGGSPVAICDAPEGRGGAWGRTNVIVLAPSTAGPIEQVSAAGGTPKPVTKTVVSFGGASDRWPFFLPDGKHFLFLHTPNGDPDERNEVRFASLDGDKEDVLLRGRYYSFQYASGWLLTNRAGSLQAWRFDPSNGKLSGDAVQLFDKVASDFLTALSVVSVSPQVLVYQQSSGETGDRHVWFDATGKQLAQVSEPGVYGATRLSPDGTRIATPVQGQNGDSDIWIWDLVGGARARLSTGYFFAESPVWSADGRVLYFASQAATGHHETRQVPADGSQTEQVLIETDNETAPADVTGDGKWLLYEETQKGTTLDSALKAFPLTAGQEPFTVLERVDFKSNARLKPASNDWLAYQSRVSGRSEVYLTRFPHPGARYEVSHTGGIQPVWSMDGKKLYYLDGSQRMTAVDIQAANGSVQIGVPRTLFQTGVRNSITDEAYDVSRDGRFLVVNSVTESTAPVVLVTNWDAELKK